MRNEILQYADLYGYNVVLAALKKEYTHVSVCANSVPTMGSLCKKITTLKNRDDVTIQKTIQHKDGTITLVTNKAYIKFLNL